LTYKCQLSGIGGNVNLDITHSGSITFMGCVIENVYYCALLSKSILSEPVLCRNYNFRISKEGIHCNITNLITSFSSTVQLGKVGEVGSGHYLLPITLFHHSPHLHSINLASVRPSNPLTLWHNRFGHSYIGLIQKMARLQTYRSRGLLIPDEFLRTTQEPDLCDICAKGKPTRDNTFIPHTRSTIKGKLWYFDVSGGGDITPALKSDNKYIIIFADSCTRMYFDYYTKRVMTTQLHAYLNVLMMMSSQP